MELMELSTDLNQIELEIKHHKNIAGQSIWEIGRRLNHVKENDLAHGEFGNWLESVEINQSTANKMMRITKELPNSYMYTNLGLTALDLITTLSEKQRDIPHSLENGEVKKPDEMTVRELQQLKRSLRQKEQEIEVLKNRPAKIVEKEVEPKDYQYLKDNASNLEIKVRKLKNKVQDKELEMQGITNQKEILERKAKLNEDEAIKYKRLKTQIENLSKQKDDLGRQIRTRTELSSLVVKTENFLKNELAPIKYSRSIREAKDDEVVNENLKDIVDRVQEWCDEMYQYVKDNDIINTEVIYNE